MLVKGVWAVSEAVLGGTAVCRDLGIVSRWVLDGLRDEAWK